MSVSAAARMLVVVLVWEVVEAGVRGAVGRGEMELGGSAADAERR